MFNENTKFVLTSIKDKVKLKQLDPSLMKEVKVFNMSYKNELTPDLIAQILSQDVCVLRNFTYMSGINQEMFQPKKLAQDYGDLIVDIVT